MASVAIIGAGFSGLAAAIELLAAGHQATLHERADEIGDRATTNWPRLVCDCDSRTAYFDSGEYRALSPVPDRSEPVTAVGEGGRR